MASKSHSKVEDAAFAITRWVGSPQSLLVHSVVFSGTIAILVAHVFSFDVVILAFNTAVSLEAIYLAIFIQMTVNRTTQSLEEVEQDIDEMQEDVGEIQEDIDEMQKDVDEIQEDVDEIQEDVGEIQEEFEEKGEPEHAPVTLEEIHANVRKLLGDIEKLRNS